MEYMLLIYGSEADGKKMSQEDGQKIYQEYMTFTQDLTKSGKNKGGNPLEQTSSAKPAVRCASVILTGRISISRTRIPRRAS